MLYRPRQQQRIKQYVTSVLLVCAASILTLAVRPWFDGKSPLLFFTLAVLLAAGYGGAAQGLLATVLSLGIALSFSREHALVLVMAKSSLALFAILGFAVSIVLGKLHHANEELSRTKDELRLSNEKLADHTDALSCSNAELQRFAYEKQMIVLKLGGARSRMRAKEGRCEGRKPYGYYEGEEAVLGRLKGLRRDGIAYDQIAAILNAESVSPRSGQWHAGVIHRLLTS